MANSFSDGKGRLVEPPYGSYVDSWNQPLSSNFGLTDALVSGTTTLNTSSLTPSTPFWTLVFQDFDTNATPWLNPLAGQNLRIVVTGALAYNATVFIPQNVPGLWIIDNQTTGPFAVNVKTTNPSSTGIVAQQGYMSTVFCDGINVRYSDLGTFLANQVQGIPSGTISAFGGVTPPSGYLLCDGAAVARSTYASLFSAIGTTWGVGDGSTTFNVPDLTNMFMRGAGTSPVGTYEADTYLNHTHAVTDPGHQHNTVVGSGIPNFFPFGQSTQSYSPVAVAAGAGTFPVGLTSSQSTGLSVATSTTGGTETRPVNKRVLYIIKT